MTNKRSVDGIALQRNCMSIHSNDEAGQSWEWSRVNDALKNSELRAQRDSPVG